MTAPAGLRRLTAADITAAHELRRLAGWNQTERDWMGYLEFEPEGCFAAEVDGQVVGTATTIAYGRRFGWIGMVLVHPAHRRGGLGTRLLNEAIRYLRSREVAAIKLDATPLGKKVYEPLGFRAEYDLTRFEGVAAPFDPPAGEDIRPLGAEPMADVVVFDAKIFGAERSRVLASVSDRNPDLCFVSRRADGIAGFIVARTGSNAVQVGPWVANNAPTAAALLGAVLRRVTGRKVFVDVPALNAAGSDLMKRIDFSPQRTLTRMFLGENRFPGTPGHAFGIGSPEKG